MPRASRSSGWTTTVHGARPWAAGSWQATSCAAGRRRWRRRVSRSGSVMPWPPRPGWTPRLRWLQARAARAAAWVDGCPARHWRRPWRSPRSSSRGPWTIPRARSRRPRPPSFPRRHRPTSARRKWPIPARTQARHRLRRLLARPSSLRPSGPAGRHSGNLQRRPRVIRARPKRLAWTTPRPWRGPAMRPRLPRHRWTTRRGPTRSSLVPPSSVPGHGRARC